MKKENVIKLLTGIIVVLVIAILLFFISMNDKPEEVSIHTEKIRVLTSIDVNKVKSNALITPAIESIDKVYGETDEHTYEEMIDWINSLYSLKNKRIVKIVQHQLSAFYQYEYYAITSNGELYIIEGNSEYGEPSATKIDTEYKITDLFFYTPYHFEISSDFNQIVLYGEEKFFYFDGENLQEFDIDNYNIIDVGYMLAYEKKDEDEDQISMEYYKDSKIDLIIKNSGGLYFNGKNVDRSNNYLKLEKVFITINKLGNSEMYGLHNHQLYYFNPKVNQLDYLGNIDKIEYDYKNNKEVYYIENIVYSFEEINKIHGYSN